MRVLFSQIIEKANERLVDYGAKEHYRVKHSKSEFANENLWSCLNKKKSV